MSNSHSTGGILKHDQFLTEKQLKQSYNGTNPKTGVSIKVAEPMEVENTYQKGIVADIDQMQIPKPMEMWSILSGHVKYVQHDDSDILHNLNFDSLHYHVNEDIYKELKEQEMIKTSINFSGVSEKLKSDYLDVYDGVYVEVISTNRFHEETDLSTTYLGQVDMSSKIEVKAEESFVMNAASHTKGELLDGTECEILLDTGMSKSYMSKSYYMQCKSLHVMPKFTSTTRRIQVGNGQYVGVLFVIPVIITIQRRRFEIFTLVSKIHENIDLVLGIKNLFKLEGVIDSRDSCLSFVNRSILFFAKEEVEVKPKEQKLITIEAPFLDEKSGMAITKLLDTKSHIALTLKLKFIRNRATLKVTNSTQEKVTFNQEHVVGIVDLRSLGYYKIKQGVLQQNLSHCYHLESAESVCQYNGLINTLRKEEQEASAFGKDKCSWLDDSDERKHMTDREILDKYIDLDSSCLTR